MIAYAAGGVLDSVIPGQTGVLFADQSVDGIIRAVEAFDNLKVETAVIRRHAEIVELADSGHFVHIEHPRRVADLVLEFLRA